MIPFIVLLLMTLLILRHSYQKNVALQYQYRLQALGDKLRMGAVQGKIETGNEAYQYLDTNIAHLAQATSQMSLWSIAAFWVIDTFRKNPSPQHHPIKSEIYKNEFALEIYEELNWQLRQCTIQKHKYSILTITAILHPKLGLASVYQRLKISTQKQVLEIQNQMALHKC